MVGLCVSLLVTFDTLAKTAEPIKMPYGGGADLGEPEEPYI